MNWDFIIILCLMSIPLFFLFGWAIFGGLSGFLEIIYFCRKDNLSSAIDGEYGEDKFSELKLFWFILTCVSLIGFEYAMIKRWAPSWLGIKLDWFWARWESFRMQEFFAHYEIEPVSLAFFIILNVPVYHILIHTFFGGYHGLKTVIYYWLKPNWLSSLSGEYDRDYVATNAFLLFLAVCALVVMGEYTIYQLICYL